MRVRRDGGGDDRFVVGVEADWGAMPKRCTCVEAGCDWDVVALDTETIMALAQRHIEACLRCG